MTAMPRNRLKSKQAYVYHNISQYVVAKENVLDVILYNLAGEKEREG
jgi:hypothetical protein